MSQAPPHETSPRAVRQLAHSSGAGHPSCSRCARSPPWTLPSRPRCSSDRNSAVATIRSRPRPCAARRCPGRRSSSDRDVPAPAGRFQQVRLRRDCKDAPVRGRRCSGWRDCSTCRRAAAQHERALLRRCKDDAVAIDAEIDAVREDGRVRAPLRARISRLHLLDPPFDQ